MGRRLTIALALTLALPAGALAQDATSLASLDARIATREGELERASVERQRVDAEIEALAGQRASAQRRLRSRVHALYRMRRAGMLPLAGGFDALLRHQARVERLERMVSRDVGSLRALRDRGTALRAETARLASEVERAQQELTSLRGHRGALERQQQQLAWPTPGPRMAGGWNDDFGMRLAGGGSIGPSFAALRGRLPLPADGSVRLVDAEREGGAGLDVLATPGVAVRAVAAGRVAYAAPHPAYGRLVIVDHGDGFYTVYGGLAGLGATVGTSVEAGGQLGTSGADPVFFQVRRGTRPLGPREWLGL